MTQSYSVVTGPKQQTRELFADAIRRFIPTPKNILLMPGEEAHDARLLRKSFPRAKIKGLDNSEEKAEHIAQVHWECIDDVFPGSVAEYAFYSEQRDNPNNPGRSDVYPRMDAIWLDYMGGCTEKNLQDLIKVIHYAAKDRCVFAATFAVNSRGGQQSADEVLLQNSCLDSNDAYDSSGQRLIEPQQLRARLNTHDKVANAVRTAIEKGNTKRYDPLTERTKPYEKVSYLRLDVVDSMTYRARPDSSPMFFFILYLERL